MWAPIRSFQATLRAGRSKGRQRRVPSTPGPNLEEVGGVEGGPRRAAEAEGLPLVTQATRLTHGVRQHANRSRRVMLQRGEAQGRKGRPGRTASRAVRRREPLTAAFATLDLAQPHMLS